MAYDMSEVQSAYKSLTGLVKIDLEVEFSSRRIKGTEYADVYNSLMGTALQLAMSAPEKGTAAELAAKDLLLKDKELELGEKKLELMQAQIDLETEKLKLTERQIQGFDDNINQKLVELQMNAWSVMYSSGLLTEKPDVISSDALSELYDDLVATVNPTLALISGPGSLEPSKTYTYLIDNFSVIPDPSTAVVVASAGGTIAYTAGDNVFTYTSTSAVYLNDVITLRYTDIDGFVAMDTKKVTWGEPTP